MRTPAQELVEWMDDQGRVLDVVTRGRMRAERLLHRAVFVVIRSPSGDVLVHRRADWKDVWPSNWDLAFGGVVGVGEPFTNLLTQGMVWRWPDIERWARSTRRLPANRAGLRPHADRRWAERLRRRSVVSSGSRCP